MRQSTYRSRQAKNVGKGNHRRKRKRGIGSSWGHVEIPMTLLRKKRRYCTSRNHFSRVNSTAFVLEKRK